MSAASLVAQKSASKQNPLASSWSAQEDMTPAFARILAGSADEAGRGRRAWPSESPGKLLLNFVIYVFGSPAWGPLRRYWKYSLQGALHILGRFPRPPHGLRTKNGLESSQIPKAC